MERTPATNTREINKTQRTSKTPFVLVRDLFYLCLSQWKWFVLSLFITMSYGVYYILKTPKIHTSSVSIMIRTDDMGDKTEEKFKEIGVTRGSSDLKNEMLSLTAIPIATEIVKRLHLEVEYLQEKMLRDDVVYGLELPLSVVFDKMGDAENASLDLSLKSDGTVTINNVQVEGKDIDGSYTIKLGETLTLPSLTLHVLPSPSYEKGMTTSLKVVRRNPKSVIASVRGRIYPQLRDEEANIIDITYRDVSVSRANDVLNTLIAVYNENWIKDRNQVSVSTNAFIKERLAIIERELGSVDQNISSFKSQHLVPDVEQAGSMAMSQASAAEEQTRNLDGQLYMVRYIRSYLTDGRHDSQLLPSNSGIKNGNIESQINEYNNVLLKRNQHLAISSDQNPLVMDLEQTLSTMRRSIIHSLDNEMAMLQSQQRTAQSSRSEATARIAASPQQAKYLLSVERQQKVKEDLYLFLLKRREQNELSQAFTAYNTRVLEEAQGDVAPVNPLSTHILFLAFIVGLAIPASVIIVRDITNTSIRGRKDIEHLRIPFVGEIPQMGDKIKRFSLFNKSHVKTQRHIVVKEGSKNVINEAFRVVRTNLEFMIGFNTTHKVIMTTSMSPGSGKTFLTANLATSLGLKGKKVIVLDLDLRKGTMSEFVGDYHHGISNYLGGQEEDYHSLIAKVGEIDILPCGSIPPNPTEMLFSPRFKEMIDTLKNEYDYIFIDCPPVEMVADTAIISPYVDLTLFVVRAGMFDKTFLPDLEEWYEEKKYGNIAILLNGTDHSVTRYGYHKYGYHYGYSYGYGKKN